MKIMSYYHLHYLPLMQIWLYYLPLMKICLYYLPLMKIRLSAIHILRLLEKHSLTFLHFFVELCCSIFSLLCIVLRTIACLFVLFLLAIILSVLYQFTVSLVSSKFSCNNQMLKYWGKSFKIFSSHVSRSCWIKQYFFMTLICQLLNWWTTLGNKFSLLLNECKKLCRQCGIFCFSFYWYLDKC